MLKKSLLSAGLSGAQPQQPAAAQADSTAFPCLGGADNAPVGIDAVTQGLDRVAIRSLPGSAPTAHMRPGSLVVSPGHSALQ